MCPSDCVIEPFWTAWSSCTAECAAGIALRNRNIITWHIGEGLKCGTMGPTYDYTFEQASPCNVQPCPIDCQTTAWSSWSDCSTTCGLGYRYQTRSVLTPPIGAGKPCGELYVEQGCQLGVCGVPSGSCFVADTSYSGPNSLVSNTSSSSECQTMCQAAVAHNDTCVSFTFDGSQNACYAKMKVTETITGDAAKGFVSGPAMCPQIITDADPTADSAGVPVGLIVGATAGGLLAAAAIGGGVYYYTRPGTTPDDSEMLPEEDFEEEYGYSAADGDQVYVGTRDFAENETSRRTDESGDGEDYDPDEV